jgi:serine/threonine protein kinase
MPRTREYKYEPIKELGRGTFGHVWLYEDKASRKQVAVKTFFTAKEIGLHHMPEDRLRAEILHEVDILQSVTCHVSLVAQHLPRPVSPRVADYSIETHRDIPGF